jgi:hypothetical protein
MVREIVIAVAVVTGVGQQPTPSPTSALDELARAEAKWQQRKPSAYEFAVEVQCFCLGLLQKPVSFRVDGTGSRPLQDLSDDSRRLYSYYETVEKLFAAVRRSLSQGQYRVNVEYDPELGYPIKADIDPRQYVADDELMFKVTAFRKSADPARR